MPGQAPVPLLIRVARVTLVWFPAAAPIDRGGALSADGRRAVAATDANSIIRSVLFLDELPEFAATPLDAAAATTA